MAKALGAVPTLIPMPDVYQSLDKGVVDGAAAPWEAIQAFRLYEVAKNYTIAPFYVAYFSLCANKRLPAASRCREVQKAWDTCAI
jgi:TRAP-type C4-dicarboxylate transport system substrate-binding protein